MEGRFEGVDDSRGAVTFSVLEVLLSEGAFRWKVVGGGGFEAGVSTDWAPKMLSKAL